MRILFATLLILLTATLSGCTTTGEGTASIYVKDAPVDDFDEIHLVFEKVEIHGSSVQDTEDENETSSGWITLYENATGRDVDLLNLTGARAAFLGEANLSAGNYQQIRVHAIEAYGIQDGERVELIMSNPVFKTAGSFKIEDGQETRITLDIDLENSVKAQGNDSYRMTPVIGKTYAEQVDDDESGEEVHEEGEVTELEEIDDA